MFTFVNTLPLCLSIIITFSLCLESFAVDQVKKLEDTEKYLVKVKDPDVYHGAEKLGVAIQGALIEVTHHRGPWRYSKELNGWIHQKNLVLLNDAVKHFSKKIQEEPNPMFFHLRGIAYMADENWGRAVNDLEEAYKLGDSSTTLHINLGTSLLNIGLTDKAKAEFTTVIKNFPDQAIAYQSRGDLLIDVKDYEAALVDLRKAAELAPKSSETYNSIGVALGMLGQYEEAVQAYNQAVEFNPDLMSAYVNRGYAYKNIKEFKKALADYEHALELKADSPYVKNDLAWLLSTCEDVEILNKTRAMNLALEACREVEYRKADYLDTLAASYARIGNFEKAVETAQSAIELFDDKSALKECEARLQLYRKKQPYTEVIESE